MKQPEALSVSPSGEEEVSLPTCKRMSLCDCVYWGPYAQYQPVLVHVHSVTQGVGASTYHVNIGSEVYVIRMGTDSVKSGEPCWFL